MRTYVLADGVLKRLSYMVDKDTDENAITNALTKACLIVEAEAKKQCPVDMGQLRASITSKVEGNVGEVGTNVEYAVYVHQGTGIYAVNGDGRTWDLPWRYQDAEGNWHSTVGQQPQPFLEKALDDMRTQIDDIFKEEFKKG